MRPSAFQHKHSVSDEQNLVPRVLVPRMILREVLVRLLHQVVLIRPDDGFPTGTVQISLHQRSFLLARQSRPAIPLRHRRSNPATMSSARTCRPIPRETARHAAAASPTPGTRDRKAAPTQRSGWPHGRRQQRCAPPPAKPPVTFSDSPCRRHHIRTPVARPTSDRNPDTYRSVRDVDDVGQLPNCGGQRSTLLDHACEDATRFTIPVTRCHRTRCIHEARARRVCHRRSPVARPPSTRENRR